MPLSNYEYDESLVVYNYMCILIVHVICIIIFQLTTLFIINNNIILCTLHVNCLTQPFSDYRLNADIIYISNETVTYYNSIIINTKHLITHGCIMRKFNYINVINRIVTILFINRYSSKHHTPVTRKCIDGRISQWWWTRTCYNRYYPLT